MANTEDFDHPAPLREEISLVSLWLGILGAPLAWTIQELFSYIVTSTICNADTSSVIPAHTDTVWLILLSINFLVLLFALFATQVAVANWQKVRHEMSGSAHDLLDAGEGRTRFLAMFGLLTSVGFVVGLIFMLLTLFLIPLCR